MLTELSKSEEEPASQGTEKQRLVEEQTKSAEDSMVWKVVDLTTKSASTNITVSSVEKVDMGKRTVKLKLSEDEVCRMSPVTCTTTYGTHPPKWPLALQTSLKLPNHWVVHLLSS
jgi:hypothetical protein